MTRHISSLLLLALVCGCRSVAPTHVTKSAMTKSVSTPQSWKQGVFEFTQSGMYSLEWTDSLEHPNWQIATFTNGVPITNIVVTIGDTNTSGVWGIQRNGHSHAFFG